MGLVYYSRLVSDDLDWINQAGQHDDDVYLDMTPTT